VVTEPVNELSEFRGNRRFSRKSATCPCFVELEGFHENLPLVPVSWNSKVFTKICHLSLFRGTRRFSSFPRKSATCPCPEKD